MRNWRKKLNGPVLRYENVCALPPQDGTCPICGFCHDPEMPHEPNSTYYRLHFRKNHGVFPTIEDAMSHCVEEAKDVIREYVEKTVNKGGFLYE